MSKYRVSSSARIVEVAGTVSGPSSRTAAPGRKNSPDTWMPE